MKHKKSYGHTCKVKLEKIINIVSVNKHIYGVKKLCKVLGVPRSIYHSKLNHTASNRKVEIKKIKE